MGIFQSRNYNLKESNSAEEQFGKTGRSYFQERLESKENIQKEIILTKAGIDGEKKFFMN
mgnify:CR=1 FL=1